jgi:hypothetical protein
VRQPQPRSRRRSSDFGGAAIAVAAAAIVYLQLLALGGDEGPVGVYAALAQMGLAILALVALGPREPFILWGLLALPLGLMGLAAGWAQWGAVAGPALAPDAVPTEMVKFAGATAMVVAGVLIGRRRARLEALCVTLAVLGLLYGLLCLGLAHADPMKVWGYPKGAHTYRFTATLLNANAAGCALGMLSVASLGAVLSLSRRFHLRIASTLSWARLAGVVAGTLACLALCALTGSRASLASSVLLGAGMIGGAGGRITRLRAGLILAGVVGIMTVTGLTLSQIGWRWDTLATDASQRAMAYTYYVHLATAHPLYGVGLGGFHALNLSRLTPAAAPLFWDYGAAHSAWLQAWLEGGWPFAALAALAVAVLIFPALAATVRRGLGNLAGGALAAVLVSGVCSSVDIALNVPAVCALACLLLGATFGAGAALPEGASRGEGERPRHALRPGGARA